MLKKDNKLYPTWLSLPAFGIYTLFTIVPILISGSLSFTDWYIARWDSPVFVGLEGYKEVISDEIFLKSIINTLFVASGTTILKTVLGLLLALALNKAFRGNSIFRTIFYMPCVLSCTVIGVLFKAVLSVDGLLNNILGIVGIPAIEWLGSYNTAMFWIIFLESWMWAGFNMFIFISGLQAIPQDYYEAASTEGASAWVQFKNITIPLLMPSITVNVTMNIAGGLKTFDMINVLTGGGPGHDTTVLSTYVYEAFGMGYLGESSAASIVLAIIVVTISFILNKYLRDREVEL